MKLFRRITALFAALSVTFCSVCSCSDESKPDPEFSVTFMDIGKADSIIIRSPESTVLIDCGEKNDGKDIVKFLKGKDISTVDYLIISHYDKDHVGGAAKVINKLDVKNVIAPDYIEISDEMSDFQKALDAKDITVQMPESDLSFELDDAEYTIDVPEKDSYDENNDNNFSLITKVVYHDNTMLFTGDAMEQRLDEIMDTGRCDLLKVPYHGRYLSNLEKFLTNTSPQCGIVCTSASEYDLETELLFRKLDIPVFSTCYNGTITVFSDGTSLEVFKDK